MSDSESSTSDGSPGPAGPPRVVGTSGQLRDVWESKWDKRRGEEFGWYISEPPAELVRLVEQGSVQSGAALDLGCGPGVVTAYLTRHFPLVLGLDIAYGAVREARELTSKERGTARFVVAEAPFLPFRDGSFSFIFDRGCMQNVSQEIWPRYMREVERLLASGGMFQLYCSKPARRGSSLSIRGVKTRVRRALRGRKPAGRNLSHDFLRRLAPPSMTTMVMEDFPFRTTGGTLRTFVHALFRKNG
jgi:SAM-dependent methyltransferase